MMVVIYNWIKMFLQNLFPRLIRAVIFLNSYKPYIRNRLDRFNSLSGPSRSAFDTKKLNTSFLTF